MAEAAQRSPFTDPFPMADAALARPRRMSNVFVPLPQPPSVFSELPSSASLQSAKPGRTRRPSMEAFQEEFPALGESGPTETAQEISDEATVWSVGYMLNRKASAEYLSDFVRSAMPSTVDNTVDTWAMRTVDTSTTKTSRSRKLSPPEAAAMQISPPCSRLPAKVRRVLPGPDSGEDTECTAEGCLAQKVLAGQQSSASSGTKSGDGADREAGAPIFGGNRNVSCRESHGVERPTEVVRPTTYDMYGVDRPAGVVRPTTYNPLHSTTSSRAVETGSTGQSSPGQGTRARFWWRAATSAWLSADVEGADGAGHHRQRGAMQRERDPLSLSVGGDGAHQRHRRHQRRASDGHVLHHSRLDTLSSDVGRPPSAERGADGAAALSEKALRECGAAPGAAANSVPDAGSADRGVAQRARSSAIRRASMSDAAPSKGQEGVFLGGQAKSVARQQTMRALGGVLPGKDTQPRTTHQDLSLTEFYRLMKNKFPEVSGRSTFPKTTSLSNASGDAKAVGVTNSSPDGKPS